MRNLSSGTLGAILSSHLHLAFFIEANFASGPVFIWNGLGNISWNSQTWAGVGNLVTISSVSEGTDVSAKGVTLTLSSIPTDLLGLCLNEVRQDSQVNLWLGFLDDSGNVIADPYQSFVGHMDTTTFNEGVSVSTVDLTLENALIDMNRSPNRRFTHDDQKIDYPDDEGFVYVSAIQTWNGTWGKAGGGTSPGAAPPPGAGSTGGSGGSGGRGGGGGGGGKGGCFSGNVAFQIPTGYMRFDQAPIREWFDIVNMTGVHKARLVVHYDWHEEMLDMGQDQLVTFGHYILEDGDWHPAINIQRFAGCETVGFVGTVYNLEILTDNEADRHYVLQNGVVAHNVQKGP